LVSSEAAVCTADDQICLWHCHPLNYFPFTQVLRLVNARPSEDNGRAATADPSLPSPNSITASPGKPPGALLATFKDRSIQGFSPEKATLTPTPAPAPI